jgi:hypothetical protein
MCWHQRRQYCVLGNALSSHIVRSNAAARRLEYLRSAAACGASIKPAVPFVLSAGAAFCETQTLLKDHQQQQEEQQQQQQQYKDNAHQVSSKGGIADSVKVIAAPKQQGMQ